MNAQELLVKLTEKQIDRIFRIARTLPEDKLDWSPAPGARSALCQLQEVATALPEFWAAFSERKLDWNQEKMTAWLEERKKITSIDELEKVAKENTAKLLELIRNTPEGELSAPVQMPFPGDFDLAEILAYHYWNASYHEGQIMYISSLIQA
jgi:uncharacterized damage-inducible protein DinB